MIQVSPSAKIFVGNEPVSFIKGMYALSGVCREIFHLDPLSGAYFLFRNRSGDSVRILVFDGDGLWLCTKKFATGSIKSWPKGNGPMSEVDARELLVMLWRGDSRPSAFPKLWKKVS
jgi:transposase